MRYILSIGTNMGDRQANIENAIDALNLLPYTDVIKKSSIYETEPVGYARQDDFYNAVVLVESRFEPHEMLGICLGIEAGFGRVRAIRFGPRILDIDIILAEGYQEHSDNLIVPHPRYSERRFVLQPMLELFPDGKAFGTKFLQYIDNIDGQAVRVVR